MSEPTEPQVASPPDPSAPPDPDSVDIDADEISPAIEPLGDSTNPQAHNAETNSAAAERDLCGMTHLPSGRTCGLHARHAGSCDFQATSFS